jgi:hypothetical protein
LALNQKPNASAEKSWVFPPLLCLDCMHMFIFT